jgi:hypothetical protein
VRPILSVRRSVLPEERPTVDAPIAAHPASPTIIAIAGCAYAGRWFVRSVPYQNHSRPSSVIVTPITTAIVPP